MTLRKMMILFCLILKMNEIDKIKQLDQTKRSNIIEIQNYFYQEINQRKICSKKLNKYVAAFD